MSASVVSRLVRHARLSARAVSHHEGQTPPFLIMFINSICNLTCEHCFYWRNLNQRDDLTYEEFNRVSVVGSGTACSTSDRYAPVQDSQVGVWGAGLSTEKVLTQHCM